jgi:hypothetical protein
MMTPEMHRQFQELADALRKEMRAMLDAQAAINQATLQEARQLLVDLQNAHATAKAEINRLADRELITRTKLVRLIREMEGDGVYNG